MWLLKSLFSSDCSSKLERHLWWMYGFESHWFYLNNFHMHSSVVCQFLLITVSLCLMIAYACLPVAYFFSYCLFLCLLAYSSASIPWPTACSFADCLFLCLFSCCLFFLPTADSSACYAYSSACYASACCLSSLPTPCSSACYAYSSASIPWSTACSFDECLFLCLLYLCLFACC